MLFNNCKIKLIKGYKMQNNTQLKADALGYTNSMKQWGKYLGLDNCQVNDIKFNAIVAERVLIKMDEEPVSGAKPKVKSKITKNQVKFLAELHVMVNGGLEEVTKWYQDYYDDLVKDELIQSASVEDALTAIAA